MSLLLSPSLYYPYSACLNETFLFLINSVETKNFDSLECARLQLLSVSLKDIDDDIFVGIKELLNIINSYLAALSQSEFNDINYLLFVFVFILYLSMYFLLLSYKELALGNNQDFSLEQVNYILGSEFLVSNKKLSLDNNPKYNKLYELNNININKDEICVLLNKLCNSHPSKWESFF
jgi:hypothetical protein